MAFLILAFTAFAAAQSWVQPRPTLESENVVALDGWTPKPTAFAEMVRRQNIPASDTICGYVSGDPAASLDCSGLPCGYNTLYSWFGCCAATAYSGTSLVAEGCPVVTDCVPYSLLDECTGNCAINTFVLKCMNVASPYCATGSLLLDVNGFTDIACAPSPFTVEVYLEPTSSANTGAHASQVSPTSSGPQTTGPSSVNPPTTLALPSPTTSTSRPAAPITVSSSAPLYETSWGRALGQALVAGFFAIFHAV